MTNSGTFTVCGALLLALGLAVSAAPVPMAGHTAYLTFERAVALPGVTLNPGTYIFERATPLTSHHVVRVRTRDRQRVMFQGFTQLVERPQGDRTDRPIAIGEAPSGSPQPILVWYPDGAAQGHRFLYR